MCSLSIIGHTVNGGKTGGGARGGVGWGGHGAEVEGAVGVRGGSVGGVGSMKCVGGMCCEWGWVGEGDGFGKKLGRWQNSLNPNGKCIQIYERHNSILKYIRRLENAFKSCGNNLVVVGGAHNDLRKALKRPILPATHKQFYTRPVKDIPKIYKNL